MNKDSIKLTEREIKEIVDDTTIHILNHLKNVDAFLTDHNVDKNGRFLLIQRVANAVLINCNPGLADIALQNIRPQVISPIRKDEEEWI